MNVKNSFLIIIFRIVFVSFLFVSITYAASSIPGGVTSRIKKINNYVDKTEERLKSGSNNRNDLDRAVEELQTIKKSYPDFATHADVVAAEKRIENTEKSLSEASIKKENAISAQKNAAESQDKIYTDWAKRLSVYKANTDTNSKGYFGISSEDVQTLLSNKKNYEEAKTLYAEFLQTGIDKDSHFELRQAEYDIKVAILNYESSMNRIPEIAKEKLEEAIKWMNEQKVKNKVMTVEKSQQQRINLLVENSNMLFPNTEMIRNINTSKALLDKMNEEADKSILENRKMKPSLYRGKDTKELIELSKSIVIKDSAKANILKVNITSQDWVRESVVEWTDTTKTALRHRVTDSIHVQVSAKEGNDCYLFTLFLNQDEIAGKKNPIKGHVMYKERILEKNAK